MIRNRLDNRKYSLANGGSNLIITNLELTDTGVYECVAKSSAGEARASAHFTIRDRYGNLNSSNSSTVNSFLNVFENCI